MARKMLIDGEVGKATEDNEQYDFDLFVIGAGSGGVRASRFSTQFGAKDARSFGWDVNEKVDFNWKKLLQKKTEEIVRLNGIYKRMLSNAGVKLFEGEGKVVGPNEVEVTQLDGTKLRYSIATGSRAQRPPIPGQELGITSD